MLYIFIFLHQTTTTEWHLTKKSLLYIFIFLHQTTTRKKKQKRKTKLYIFIFLHQTTTLDSIGMQSQCCISLYSYIKPQLLFVRRFSVSSCISLYSYIKPQRAQDMPNLTFVVYLYIPTSNHNAILFLQITPRVVYLYIPTSNHNYVAMMSRKSEVVYLYIPTSNHNCRS